MNNLQSDFDRYGKRIVQLFWDPLPKNDDPSSQSIWLLGKQYDAKVVAPKPEPLQTSPSDLSTSQGSTGSWVDGGSHSSYADSTPPQQQPQRSSDAEAAEAEAGWPPAFMDDFESRIWLTYRSNFEPIPRSSDPKAPATMSWGVRLKTQFENVTGKEGFTSDAGYGCMIRTGQSLLANALLLLRLGRDWRRSNGGPEERQILSLFADDPKAPFSIHRFVKHGAEACGKHPGEWFGPSATSQCIKSLANGHEEAGLRVYVTGDGSEVYQDSFFKIAKSENGTFKPTLLLIGIRLGIERITPVYEEGLKALLQMPQAVGIAGGRPSASHYFVGTQGQHFFYLDPHYTRPAFPLRADASAYTTEEIDSCHTRRLRRIHVTDMDPSMLIGFLIRSEEDWRDWRKGMAGVSGKAAVHVADHEPTLSGPGGQTYERKGAIDEVETFDSCDDDDEQQQQQ